VGLMGTVRISKSVSAKASLSFSPYLWCNDMDDHVFRLIYFYSNMRGGIMLEPRASITFRLTPRIGLTLDALYRHISQLTGDSFEVQQGLSGQPDPVTHQLPGAQFNYATNGGGVSLDAGSVTLSVDLAL
jgi:Omptin family